MAKGGKKAALTESAAASRLAEAAAQYEANSAYLVERLAELELALEDGDWQRLTGENNRDFSRDGLKRITHLARLYFLKNPLLKRGVMIQTQYVWGQGATIQARHPKVNEVVQAFLDDPGNKAVLTGHQARMTKETELQIEANLFLAMFTNLATGTVRIRNIPFAEVEDIIFNPDDAAEPWFYKRVWQQSKFDMATGQTSSTPQTAYYPDWRYLPADKPQSINGKKVHWDAPVYHVAVNKLSDMKFGVSEIYAGIDWAKAYKDFLSDWFTIVKAYSRFAWNLTTKGGARGVAAAKTRLGTNLSASSGVDSNPPAATGSTFIATEGVKMEPIKTAGAQTSAEDGRRGLLMVCAALGIYEHYFGDPSTGNLATATSMERPMELMFRDRQTLWADVLTDILNYVIDASVAAVGGKIPGTVTTDADGNRVVTLAADVDNEDPEKAVEPIDRGLEISFPDILQKDVQGKVAAVISALTLNGQAPVVPVKEVVKLTLGALGVPNVDELLEVYFPEDQQTTEAPAEDAVTEAVRDLTKAAAALTEAARAA